MRIDSASADPSAEGERGRKGNEREREREKGAKGKIGRRRRGLSGASEKIS